MNTVQLIGRVTRDPENRDKPNLSIVNFTLAIDRPKSNGEKDTDFPRVVCFGKTAELAERYLRKGARVGVVGHIQTGSYERDGAKVYTTDVVAERLTIIDWPEDKSSAGDAWTEGRREDPPAQYGVDPFDIDGVSPFF